MMARGLRPAAAAPGVALAMLLLVAPGVPAKAPPAGGGVPGAGARTYDLPGHGALLLSVPAGWKDHVDRPPGDLPPKITFEPAEGEAFQVVLVPVWGPPDLPAERFTPEDARALADKQGRGTLHRAVETEIVLQEVRGPDSRGFIFALTDRAYAGSEPPAGEYRFLTQGVFLVGGMPVIAAILSQEKDGADTRAALDMLRGAHLRK